MEKRKIYCVLLVLLTAMSGFALEIKGNAPTYKASDSDPVSIALANEFNTQLASAFNELIVDLNSEVKDIDTKPEKFIEAWGNSAIYASHGATTRAYGGYKIFSATIGTMIGIQIPVSPFKIADELDNLQQKLNEEHDIALGLNPSLFNAQVGINMSFLVKNLYLGLRVGYINLDDLFDGFNFNTFTLGVTANYQLLPSITIVPVLLTWRGISLGSGVIYNGTTAGYSMSLGRQSESINSPYGNNTIEIDPKLVFNMDISTVTIPLEAITAVKLLIFNIPVGLGIDIGFGKSDMKAGLEAPIYLTGNTGGLVEDKQGSLSVTAGGDVGPQVFNLKLMTGFGFHMGPVVIDIPFTYYFRGNGFNIGLTIGAVY